MACYSKAATTARGSTTVAVMDLALSKLFPAVVILFAAANRLNAQVHDFGSIATCGTKAPGLGSIEGRLIADSPNVRLERGVFVNGIACLTLSDSTGWYALHGLPPGAYRLEVGDLGVRRVDPLTVRVAADSTTNVDIHLRPENLVLDCMEDSRCAPLIAPMDSRTRQRLDDDEQLLEMAIRTTVALSRLAAGDGPEPGALCVGISNGKRSAALPEAVLEAVQARIPTVRSPSHCEKVGGDFDWELRTRDGLSAWQLEVASKRTGEHSGASSSSYSVRPLWAAGWECRYERGAEGWRPDHCGLSWIS